MSKEYAIELGQVLANLPFDKIEEAIEYIKTVTSRQGVFYTCGNGGSASTASHLVCDLVKNTVSMPTVKAFCLNDNIAMITAIANDFDYSEIFAAQLTALPSGCLIAISTSGNSPNVVNAAKVTKGRFYGVIALTGNNGGKLAGLADIEIRVPSNRIQIIEDAHLAICHMIAIGLGA